MNRLKLFAVIGSAGAVAALCLCSAAGAADEAKGPSVSRFLAKPLKEAQDAMRAHNFDLELQKLQEAQNAKGTKTAYDEYLINAMVGTAYAGQNNYAQAAPALMAAAESQYASPSQQRAWMQAVVSIYYQLHQYAKAIDAGQASIRHGVGDSSVYTTIAAAQEALGQHKEAAQTVQQLIDKEPKPEEKYLEFQWDAYNKANDQADASRVIDKLVTYYPKPDYWLNALAPLLKMTISDSHLQLDVYRLMNDVGVLKRPSDYGEMAALAFDAGYPGETVSILQKAFAQNVFTDQRDVLRYQHLLGSAMQRAQADEASLPAQQAKAQSDASGDALVAVGAAYLSYGQADKAASVIAMGIAKGNLKYPEQADVLLGMAQLRSHNVAAAHHTFDKLANSSNEGYAQLGRLWVLHSEAHPA